MNKTLLVVNILLIVLFSNNLCAQQVTFNDTLRPFGSATFTLNAVCEDDSFYYVMGGVNNAIVKLDKNGQIVKKNRKNPIGYYFQAYPYNCMVMINDVILTCGIGTDTLNKDFGVILAYDKQTLDTLWIKRYEHPDTIAASQPGADVWSGLTSIKPVPDGNFVLTGNYNKNCIIGNIRSFLMKIDSVGNVIWRKTYNDVSYLFDIEVTNDGGFAIFYPFGWQTANFRKTDSTGAILWTKQINSLGGWATASSITLLSDSFALGARTYMYNNDISYPLMGLHVFKINLNTEQILWDKTYRMYQSVDCPSLHQAIGIDAYPDGTIYVSGTTKHYGRDAFILNINSNGDSLWTRTYYFGPEPWDRQLNDLIITQDGGFMGVGVFVGQYSYGRTAWMFKTDSNGVINWNNELVVNDQQQLVKCFPNPATTEVFVECPALKNSSSLDVNIFNTIGESVHSETINKCSGRFTISIDRLDAGVHLIQIITDDGKILKGKILKV